MTAQTKFWNGSAYVAPTNFKVWTGSAYAAPVALKVWTGSAYVTVWPTAQPSVTTIYSTTNTSSSPNAATYSYTPPSWWRNGTDYLDVIVLGGGGGGGGYNGGYGNAQAGSWDTYTTQTFSAAASNVGVGYGGTGASVSAGAAGTASAFNPSGIWNGAGRLQANGGAGGVYGFGQSTQYYNNAGVMTYQGVTVNPSPYTDGKYYGRGGQGAAVFGTGFAGGGGMAIITARWNTSA